MAIKYAVATGNWSSTATWNGGTLPTSADDVYSNTFTVTIDQNITVLSLNNTATTGVTAGGNFACSTARTINCSGGAGFVSGTVTLLALTGAVTITTLGTIQPAGASQGMSVGATTVVNHTGNLNSVIASAQCVNLANTATINVTGNLNATLGYCIYAAVSNSSTTITVTGSVTCTNTPAIFSGSNSSNTNCTCTITGAVSTTGSSPAVLQNWNGLNGAATTIYGTITASTSSPAVALGGSGLNSILKATGPFIGTSSGYLPYVMHYIGSSFRLIPIANNEFRMASNSGGTSSFYSSDMTSGPAIGDVRNGTSYTYGGVTQTGTLKVPSPAYVAVGVQTDATVGTYNPAADVWAYTISTGVAAKDRLLATATIDSTGGQIQAATSA